MEGAINMAIAKAQNVYRNYKQGDDGEAVATIWLQKNGWLVINKSKDPDYRKRDIDLLCFRSLDGKFPEYATVECKKDDRGFYTANLVLETVSNTTKGTPGWTMYTEAQYISILQNTLLHILPGPRTVEWFKDNYSRFIEITFPTVFKDGENVRYYAKARLVPRHIFDLEVGIIETIDLVAEGIIPAKAA
jgi:hypothetical protein